MIINKNILLISPERWDHIFVSKHHYAVHLSAYGNHVFFLNPPGPREMVSETLFGNLRIIDYRGFVKGLRWFPAFFRKYFIRKKFEHLQRLSGAQFDIVWSFDNSVFFEFSALPANVKKISHIVDLNQNFETARAASSADICFGVIPAIVERLKRFNKKTFLIPHGVNNRKLDLKPGKLPGDQRMKALYAGNLAMPHINWKLLAHAADRFENVDFVFFGSNRELIDDDGTAVFRKGNVFFHEGVSAAILPAYLAQAGILIYAYTEQYYRNYATPHKVLEYLLTGNPIVGSFTPEYQTVPELIYMGRSDQEWLQQFEYVVNHYSFCAREEARKMRRSFAENHSYDKQLARISQILEDSEPQTAVE